MEAFVLISPHKLRGRNEKVTPPEGDEVVIDIKACWVCGTDLHIYSGDVGAFEAITP